MSILRPRLGETETRGSCHCVSDDVVQRIGPNGSARKHLSPRSFAIRRFFSEKPSVFYGLYRSGRDEN